MTDGGDKNVEKKEENARIHLYSLCSSCFFQFCVVIISFSWHARHSEKVVGQAVNNRKREREGERAIQANKGPNGIFVSSFITVNNNVISVVLQYSWGSKNLFLVGHEVQHKIKFFFHQKHTFLFP